MSISIGPWSIVGPSKPQATTPEGGDFAILDASGEIIGETFARSSKSVTHDARAHAQLFAAAPQLMEALQNVLGFCATNQGFEAQMAIDDARAALAAAGVQS
jgi:hypothetical protein